MNLVVEEFMFQEITKLPSQCNLIKCWLQCCNVQLSHVLILVSLPLLQLLFLSQSKPEGLWLIDLSPNWERSYWEDRTFVTSTSYVRLCKNEDYLTGSCMALSWPVPGCVVSDWTEDRDRRWSGNWSSNQRRQGAQESETRLDVEPVFPAGGVYRQWLPVHWQGKSCASTSKLLVTYNIVPYVTKCN